MVLLECWGKVKKVIIKKKNIKKKAIYITKKKIGYKLSSGRYNGCIR